MYACSSRLIRLRRVNKNKTFIKGGLWLYKIETETEKYPIYHKVPSSFIAKVTHGCLVISRDGYIMGFRFKSKFIFVEIFFS